MSDWSIEESASLYGINDWGSGYFRINDKGNISVTPYGAKGPSVDLKDLTEDLRARGLRTPILIRFPDIVKARIQLLANCFSKAILECGYKGSYCGVYPIKVNQQRDLVREIVNYGQFSRLGLECGSKPELLVVLAYMSTPNALVICNGFKDEEYVETALLSQKLGRNTIIVVDRFAELPIILTAAKKLNIKPRIGLRVKLDSQGAGKWVESSGARSKFGLTAPELVDCIDLLKKDNSLDSLQLLHFHIGSQITSIQAVKSALKEGARYFSELCSMGARIKYMDVGGGLGVDYDGSAGLSDNSINYTEQEYANDVVSIVQSICDENDIPHPDIVTESGRALVAHHSVLVFDVIGTNELRRNSVNFAVTEDDHELVQKLYEIWSNIKLENLNESYNDTIEVKEDSVKLYVLGYLGLGARAKIEDLFWASMTKMADLARGKEEYEDLMLNLDKDLSDTYFSNFSIFQSTPDSWAVDQVFPYVPIHRLQEKPDRKAVLVDITCDSDGCVDSFIECGTVKPTINVHPYRNGENYFLGIFLLGAYQEILGDLHNLFGDTDAVHITIGKSGYTVDQVIEGDSVAEVLTYVQYNRADLINMIRKATEEGIQRGSISMLEARLLLQHYESGLAGYTYLE